jgi:hypothetical protein
MTDEVRRAGEHANVLSLRRIGYWKPAPSGIARNQADEWPDPASFVDASWDADLRDMVADYLDCGFVWRAFAGLSPCRLCGQSNGALELSDGAFLWPSGLAHYIRDHQVRLPAEFVKHVERFTGQLEDAAVDDAWWYSFAANGSQ